MTAFTLLSSWHCHCQSSPGSSDEYSTAPGGRRPLDQASQPEPIDAPKPAATVMHSPFVATQPESWYSFYHPAEGRRLSQPGWPGYILRWFTRPQAVTHPSTNQAQWSVALLIKHNVLPLHHHTTAIIAKHNENHCCYNKCAVKMQSTHTKLVKLKWNALQPS